MLSCWYHHHIPPLVLTAFFIVLFFFFFPAVLAAAALKFMGTEETVQWLEKLQIPLNDDIRSTDYGLLVEFVQEQDWETLGISNKIHRRKIERAIDAVELEASKMMANMMAGASRLFVQVCPAVEWQRGAARLESELRQLSETGGQQRLIGQ
jgi:nitroreductase